MTTGVHEYRLVTVMPQWLSNSHHVSSMDDSRCEVIAAAGGESESYARHGGRFMSGGRYDERRDVLHHRNHWRRQLARMMHQAAIGLGVRTACWPLILKSLRPR